MNGFYGYYPCMQGYFRQGAAETQFPTGNVTQVTPMDQGMPTFPLPAIGTTFPTGVPVGPAQGGFPMAPGALPMGPGTMTAPQPAQMEITPPGEIPSITTQSTLFVPGYLKTQIGKKVRVEFLIGTNGTTDRTGTLIGVGASYILLRLEESDDIMLCDLYSIKFVTFFF